MTPRFIGDVNFARMNPNRPELWQLEEPFAQVTSDGYLAIARPWKSMNGASIPRIAQLIPKMGSPFEGSNKFWFPVHDQGYHGDALVIRLLDIKDVSPDILLSRKVDAGWIYESFEELHVDKSRSWYDQVMVEAMQLKNEPSWKQAFCWTSVRVGGWKNWKGR